MKVLFLVIAFLFISSTAWGFWGDFLQGVGDGLEELNSPQARQARAEREYLERQTELEQQLLEQEQQRINTEQQLILQQQWQLFQQQQQQLSHAQLEQKKELRLQLQKQESLQKRQEFIQLYILTTEQATKAESNVTHSNLSVNPPNTIDSPSNKYAFFATKLSNVYHKPNCSMLVASNGLIRFDTPQKACKAGCLPCNYCKPD
jgi:hypothetical protein